VADGQPLAFDEVFARRRDVEQQVDDVILEQVDLVDVQEPAVWRARATRTRSA